MTWLSSLFAFGTVLLVALCLITVWAPRRLVLRVAAVALTANSIIMVWLALTLLLGLPKPASMEFFARHAKTAGVVSSVLIEDRGIYLWLMLPDNDEPRAYVFPWNREMAGQLSEAQNGDENSGQLRMRFPFEPSLDEEKPRFYQPPQPAMPPKDLIDPPAHRFEQPT